MEDLQDEMIFSLNEERGLTIEEKYFGARGTVGAKALGL